MKRRLVEACLSYLSPQVCQFLEFRNQVQQIGYYDAGVALFPLISRTLSLPRGGLETGSDQGLIALLTLRRRCCGHICSVGYPAHGGVVIRDNYCNAVGLPGSEMVGEEVGGEGWDVWASRQPSNVQSQLER